MAARADVHAAEDECQGARRASLGASGARRTSGLESPTRIIGEPIRIRGIQFIVIGVLASKGQASAFGNPDDQILIPIHTARYRVFGNDRLRSISVLAQSEDEHSAGRWPRSRRSSAASTGCAPGPAGRLPDPQPGGLPRHLAETTQVVHAAAGRHRGRLPARRRHRHHEHHAGLGHRAHARDRRAQGARRDAAGTSCSSS